MNDAASTDRQDGRAPLVSVVLPCFNAHRHLRQTLDSVRAQTFRDFEIVVVDDGSNDPETLTFLDSVGDDVRLIRQRNYGLPAARNTAFRHARGTYVLPLDCDDWLEPTFLERAIAKIRTMPPRSFVFSHLSLCGDMSGTVEKEYNHFEQLFLNQLPYCLLLPKSVWCELGGYDESMRRGYEDWEFNIRLGRHGVVGAPLREPLFHYRVSQTGMLKAISGPRHGTLWRDIQKKNPNAYRLRGLVASWLMWREKPSTYYLGLYFFWLALHRVLPKPLFAKLFQKLMPYSQSARVSRKAMAG
ncbi:glycosyltransferase family 2 protein [Shumkonia mesophila]|uniref:glycosyltransferase family 2 protein n=1 Tax=Shumkonia mesophila TaxID=2838854 RepID=UPI0029345EC2|nr:glycosyltransferase family A protein [Shumkonia mesophila]